MATAPTSPAHCRPHGSDGGIAFAETCRAHWSSMHRVACLFIDWSEAEDVVQEVLARLWVEPDAFDPSRGNLHTFLLMRTRGRAIERWRANASRHARESNPIRVADAARPPPADGGGSEALDEVTTCVGRLPADQRQAITLAYFAGYTYREVAEILGRPEGTVKSCIRAGLKELRADLAGVAR